MKFTKEHRKAFEATVKKFGSVNGLAVEADISNATLYNIFNNNPNYISVKTYNKLYPFIKDHLKDSEILSSSGDLTELDKLILSKLKSLSETQKTRVLELVYSLIESSFKSK